MAHSTKLASAARKEGHDKRKFDQEWAGSASASSANDSFFLRTPQT
jgi:hypothetical protein